MLIEELNELRTKLARMEEKLKKYETLVINASGKTSSVQVVKKNIERLLFSQNEVNQELAQNLHQAKTEVKMLEEQVQFLKRQINPT